MATLAKKIYMKNSAGTQQTALIYSTAAEAGSPYMFASDGSTTGYVSLCSTSDARATSGRVIKGGTTYAIGSKGPVAYKAQKITTLTAGTWTVPANVTKLRVTCVGGGAGAFNGKDRCGSCLSGTGDDILVSNTASAGGKTTFGSVTANGAGHILVYYDYSHTTCETSRDSYHSCTRYYDYSHFTMGGGYNAGKMDTCDCYTAGGAGYTLKGIDGTTYGTYGAGGAVSGGGSGSGTDISGSSGYVTVTTITVTPGATLSYQVGAGGSKDCFSNYCNDNPTAGTQGAILVEYGGSIV